MDLSKYKLHPGETMDATGMYPDDQGINKRSNHALSVWAAFLFEMVRKIQFTATDDQKKKYLELQQAYSDIVKDVTIVNYQVFLVEFYKRKTAQLEKEKAELKKEVDKLTSTLNFNQE